MIARSLVVALLLVTALVLQTALFPAVTLFGFRPDLLLLIVVAVALHDGSMAGARVGAAAGLLVDLLVSQAPVGLSIVVYASLGHVIGLARPYLATDSVTAPLLLAFATGALGTAGYGLLTSLLADEPTTTGLVVRAALSVGLYNTLLAPVAYAVVGRLAGRFPLTGAPSRE